MAIRSHLKLGNNTLLLSTNYILSLTQWVNHFVPICQLPVLISPMSESLQLMVQSVPLMLSWQLEPVGEPAYPFHNHSIQQANSTKR